VIVLLKGLALVVVVATSFTGTWLIDSLVCVLLGCLEDDASWLAGEMVSHLLLAICISVSVFAVFLPAVILRRSLGILAASIIPSLLVALGIWGLFFDRTVDSLSGNAAVILWLTGPWFFANLVGLSIWRRGGKKPSMGEVGGVG